MPPGLGVAAVACMDVRNNVYGILGLNEGDAHVIRNAGDVVSEETIRSLAISQRLLGTTQLILIHHADCGRAHLRPRAVQGPDRVRYRDPTRVGPEAFVHSTPRCPPVDQPGQGESVPAPHRPRTRLVYDDKDGTLTEI